MVDAVRAFPPTPLHVAVGNCGELDTDAALRKQSALTSDTAALLGPKGM